MQAELFNLFLIELQNFCICSKHSTSTFPPIVTFDKHILLFLMWFNLIFFYSCIVYILFKDSLFTAAAKIIAVVLSLQLIIYLACVKQGIGAHQWAQQHLLKRSSFFILLWCQLCKKSSDRERVTCLRILLFHRAVCHCNNCTLSLSFNIQWCKSFHFVLLQVFPDCS